MALFGSSEKKSSAKTVRPTVVHTQNVAKELMAIAKSYEVSINTLDFNILDISTYTRINDGTKEIEWEAVDTDLLYQLNDENTLLNPYFQIKQTYEIEIFSPSKKTYKACPKLKVAVGANASKCKVYFSIAEGSVLEYNASLKEDLKSIINKRKIRAGILINIFDEMVNDAISKITAQARIEEKIEYPKVETILIAEGFEPTVTTDDSLIFHYEDCGEIEENKKVDYASRGFIQSVKKNELLIEYVKPRIGISGRNCRGEFIKPRKPIVENEVTFNIDDTINIVETDESIEYRANENGYIAFDANTYVIKTDMDVCEISFRTTGNINSGVDSDVSLSVKETDAIKDAIGTGMSVEVSEIDIEGNVGSNASVIALRATVAGQTHKTATIKADKLDINIHKGKAYGKDITITRLEHGEVDGDIVHIAQAYGGQIRAKEVEIQRCASHVKITSSKRIEIKKLQGSENIFTIDPLLKSKMQKEMSDNQDTIKELKDEVRDLKKEITQKAQAIKDGTPAFLEIKKRLVHYKKSGVKLPSSFVKKYKQFTQLQEYLKGIKEEYNVKNDHLNLQTTKTASFQDNILDARVINRDKWMGYNEIKFKLVDPPIELVHRPAEGSKDMIFGLVEIGNGKFEIQAVEE
jgi:hypothetical protein